MYELRQDPEKLAKEIDGLEGGRMVDTAAVKAWLKNRLPYSLSLSLSLSV